MLARGIDARRVASRIGAGRTADYAGVDKLASGGRQDFGNLAIGIRDYAQPIPLTKPKESCGSAI